MNVLLKNSKKKMKILKKDFKDLKNNNIKHRKKRIKYKYNLTMKYKFYNINFSIETTTIPQRIIHPKMEAHHQQKVHLKNFYNFVKEI